MAVMSNGMILNKKIKDATATSSDVLSGKVFYNNDGRQLGTYEEVLDGLKCITIYSNETISGSYTVPSNDDVCARTFSSSTMSSYRDSSYGGTIRGFRQYSISGQILFALVNNAYIPAGVFYGGGNLLIIKDFDSFAVYIRLDRSSKNPAFYYKHNYNSLAETIKIDIFYR